MKGWFASIHPPARNYGPAARRPALQEVWRWMELASTQAAPTIAEALSASTRRPATHCGPGNWLPPIPMRFCRPRLPPIPRASTWGGAAYRKVNPGGPAIVPSSGGAFLRKLDGSGNEVWARRFGTDSLVAITSLALDS